MLDINDDIYGPDKARVISVKAWDCEQQIISQVENHANSCTL